MRSRGQAILITVIILALLGAFGIAGLHVAGLNMLIAANERDAKDALFQADSGVNMGHTFLEQALKSANASFYDDGTNASAWQEETTFNPAEYPMVWNREGGTATYVRCGMLSRDIIPGAAVQIGTGYEGLGHSASWGAVSGVFLIRARRVAHHGSHAEVDLGWKHVIR